MFTTLTARLWLPGSRPSTTITPNVDGFVPPDGTLLNGISEGAAYGDDWQMNSNYPIVRLTDAAGNVYYARTFTGAAPASMTGTTPETTEFRLPTRPGCGNVFARRRARMAIARLRPRSILPTRCKSCSGTNSGTFWPSVRHQCRAGTATDLVASNWVVDTDTVNIVGNSFVGD